MTISRTMKKKSMIKLNRYWEDKGKTKDGGHIYMMKDNVWKALMDLQSKGLQARSKPESE